MKLCAVLFVMKVIFDTTVFGHGFNAQSADVRLIKKFLNSTSAELCVPTMVIDEAVNLARKSIEESNKSLGDTQRLTGDSATFKKVEVKTAVAKYRSDLDSLLQSLKARILPYPAVSHADLAKRALDAYKPFVSGGRGYRDALIWYTMLDLASSCKGEEIAFISGNTHDWCKSKTEIELHSDLVKDLKSKGIDAASFKYFDSLASFVEKYAIETLPVSSPSVPVTAAPADYQQLLVDGDEAIKTMLSASLPDFLRSYSRADLQVEELEVVGTSAATDIRASQIRMLDNERRVLQFSGKYRVAFQCLIQKTDLAIWAQRLSVHQRQDWDSSRLRIQATTAVRVLFHLIQKGENTESFSVGSVAPAYYSEYDGFNPVAIKLHQSDIHAPDHASAGVVKCDSCGEEFGIGYHRLYPQGDMKQVASKLEQILSTDHKNNNRPHENIYELPS